MNTIRQLFILVCLALAAVRSAGAAETSYIPEILIVNDDAEAALLEEQGVVIWHRRADMALALVPGEAVLPTRARAGADRRARSFPRRNMPVMNVAKTYFEAFRIHSGSGLPQPYTGEGVVVGFCDTAFDPNHINFKDKDGNSRVRKLVHYNETAGERTILTDPAEIAEWTTDNPHAYHATHVGGIMAGSYKENGYGGMAPDADIVAVTASLYDVGILAGCEEILDYARSVGKPAVINLSLAGYNGPHDGTTLFNRYMSLIGEEAIVCMAAGNSGDDHSSYRITFSEETPKWRVALYGNDWVHFHIMGLTDAWSADHRPVRTRFLVYDNDTKECVYESAEFDFDGYSSIELNAAADPALAEFMTGNVWISGRVDQLNGRWVTEVEYDTTTTAAEANSGGLWARYHPALEFSGAPGVHADINADEQYSFLSQMRGWPAPGAELSVSDIATGENVIVVGMYNNQDHIPKLDGTERVFNFDPFHINEGSAYGTLIDGRVLPHTVAPGGGVVSSSNRYYTAAHPDALKNMHAVVEENGEKYYWASDGGTSMATPYVAGTIATWLQAVPTLTVGDVKHAIEVTNFRDYPDPLNPRHGHGWLRPYEGLKQILLSMGVSGVTAIESCIKIVSCVQGAEILNPAGEEITYRVANASGVVITPGMYSSERIVPVDMSAMPAGIYIITARVPGKVPVSFKLMKMAN